MTSVAPGGGPGRGGVRLEAQGGRPRVRTGVERDGAEVTIALRDDAGRSVTLRLGQRAASSLSLLVRDAAEAPAGEEPSYEVDVLGELTITPPKR